MRPVTTGEPSPKSQLQSVAPPVEVSLTVTSSGAAPLVGLAPNEAVGGGGAWTWTVRVAIDVPVPSVTLRVRA